MEFERFVSPENLQKDGSEKSLRPQSFENFMGQKSVIKNITLMVESAKKRGKAMDHVLFSGPPGLGKTSLSMLIAKELDVNLHTISGPAIEKKGDIAAILTNLEAGDMLFIDEIHRMHISVEEILYSAMEDFRLDIVLGQGPSARTMQIDIPHFTLIGATTRAGLLSHPLRDRFVAHLSFDFYSPKELSRIIERNASQMKLEVSSQAVDEMARRSRGTPRIANRILKRVRDFSIVYEQNQVTEKEVKAALDLMEIDQFGLDKMDRKILAVIRDYYGGGPVGVEALAATLGEERGTIEDVYEPFLLKEGFLVRTPRGRQITDKSAQAL